jgi:hypothetical protein
MTTPYLDRLRAVKFKIPPPHEPSKLTKPVLSVERAPDATRDGGFVSFDSAPPRGISNFGKASSRVLAVLEIRCPEHIPLARWQQCVADGRRFVAQWGEQAERLGWTSKDLFGLLPVPEKPHPTFSRLSRYEHTGLIWLLHGCPVIALTEATAAIQNPSGAITIYRKHNKPALGPTGDSVDDLE